VLGIRSAVRGQWTAVNGRVCTTGGGKTLRISVDVMLGTLFGSVVHYKGVSEDR